MNNFKGLHKYAQGGIKTEDFAPGNTAKTNMVTANPSRVPEAMSGLGDGGGKNKGTKKARQYNKKHMTKLACHKRNT
jgi:hypothetical protein